MKTTQTTERSGTEKCHVRVARGLAKEGWMLGGKLVSLYMPSGHWKWNIFLSISVCKEIEQCSLLHIHTNVFELLSRFHMLQRDSQASCDIEDIHRCLLEITTLREHAGLPSFIDQYHMFQALDDKKGSSSASIHPLRSSTNIALSHTSILDQTKPRLDPFHRDN